MKNFFTAGVLALLILACSFARADEKIVEPKLDPNSPTVIKAKMLENYLAIREAFKNADPDFLISFETPDYSNVLKSGEVRGKEKSDEMVRFMMGRIKKIHNANVVVKSIDIQPQRVVVLNTQFMDADILGPDNRIHRFSATTLSRDIWVKYGSEWRLKRAEDLKMNSEY